MFRYSLGRVYQELKSIMMGMGHDNSMIYSQDDTIIELTHKLNMTVSILNSAPILVKNNDEDERLVFRQEILKPYLSKESIDTFVGDLLSIVTGNRDGAEKGTNLGQQPVTSP